MAFKIAIFFSIVAFWANPLHARIKAEEPWFAGNIIAFFARNTPKGKFATENYLYAFHQGGAYDNRGKLVKDRNIHQYQLEIELRRGLLERIDIELQLNLFYTHNKRHDLTHFGDTKLFFGFQILEDTRCSWKPDIRLLFGEIFPTGKYQNLRADLQGADGVGGGGYKTFLIFIARKIYYWNHPFNWTVNFFYALSSDVKVEGSNIFGLDPKIRGEVSPGVDYYFDLALEYKFNRPLGCGIDIFYEHQNSSSFKRASEEDPLLPIPSTDRFSLAPCIEYNFTDSLSILLGSWFTLFGRNETAFTSAVLSLYYEF